APTSSPRNGKMKSLLPQCFVPVRYAHLHCALGEEDNQQQQSTTMFKAPNLFQDLTAHGVFLK
ncbi:MAG TPA: hypothetical protein VFC44_26325, partial [Candidatus Saccharimonadales bacterium]|nr:hypothetical protein [Candidatus Saccharimonadales bacterium]